jgi:hypothetical protein
VIRVSRQQYAACRRATGLARWLARDLEQLLADGVPPSAHDLRTAVRRIDLSLAIALGLDPGADAELAYRRGHARNVALVLRRTLEASLNADAGARVELLSQAARFADELSDTVMWIRGRAAELDAPTPVQAWTRTCSGRLIALAARLLPPELQREFVEDQCGNLACVESRREWIGYLLGLLTRMPRIAAAAAPGRSRW